MKPQRIQLSRRKGWRMPPNTVKVDRTTRWGNPFIVEREEGQRWLALEDRWIKTWRARCLCNPHRHGSPMFSDYRTLLSKEAAVSYAIDRFRAVIAPHLNVEALRGKNLACWCPLDQPCHADVLLELANREGEREQPR